MSVWIREVGFSYRWAIQHLERVLRECPDELWERNLWDVTLADEAATPGSEGVQTYGTFWYVAFHTLLALDGFLSPTVPFDPPPPFRAGVEARKLPEKAYTREELLDYLQFCRRKAEVTFASLTDEKAMQIRGDEQPFANSLIRGLMHLREHTGQLGLFLGVEVAGWIPM